MESPPLRLAVVFGVLVAALGAAAGTARADESAVRATAVAFVDALNREDAATACRMLASPALARVGGPERCLKTLGGDREGAADYRAISTLQDAFRAAEKSAVRRRGAFVTKSFRLAALARDMQRIDDELTVRVGRGPRAAAGQLPTTVVLDTRSNARRVVLYAESDDGSIFRLSGAMLGHADVDEVAQGIAEASPPAAEPREEGLSVSFQVDHVIEHVGGAFVRGTLVYQADGMRVEVVIALELVLESGSYLVNDYFYSLISLTQDP